MSGVRVIALLGWMGLTTVGTATAQHAPDSFPRPRSITLLAGVGNAMGWVGLSGEKYFLQSRVSVFAGLGYTPEMDQGDATGVAVAGGIRAFTPGVKHRGFLELSLSQVAIQQYCFNACHRLYGPGLQAGYQFVTIGGFTLFVSGGFGFVLDRPPGAKTVTGMGGLGLGYTWRRRSP